MLTKHDLAQIEEIVERVVERKVEEIVEKKLAPIRRELKQIRKDLNLVIKVFDSEIYNLKNRTTRIETHLKLPN